MSAAFEELGGRASGQSLTLYQASALRRLVEAGKDLAAAQGKAPIAITLAAPRRVHTGTLEALVKMALLIGEDVRLGRNRIERRYRLTQAAIHIAEGKAPA